MSEPGAQRVQLDEALRQIAGIRQQMVQREVFRGYRAATVAFSGVAGIVAAGLQRRWVPSPENTLGRYLGLWLGVAVVSLLVAALELWWRASRETDSGLAREGTLFACQQFLPTVAVGGFLTLCIYLSAPQVAWMLPGLWALVFGLGVFASCRLLPRAVSWVGAYYVVCGGGALLWGQGANAFAPWQMGVTFGGGQLLGAAILYWTLERTDAS